MTIAWEILSATLILAGSVIIGLAAFGVARLPDPFTRMHAATKAGVVGSGLLLLGAAATLGGMAAWITAIAGVAFLLATTPIAAHVLGRAAYIAGAPIHPATMSDALAGVLDRRVFDIDPARRPRARLPAPPEGAMTPVPLRDQSRAAAATSAETTRRIVCWLGGGAAQREAIEYATQLSAASGAKLLGLTALDPAPSVRPEAIPAGGGYWARWSADRRRAHMREVAASALREFESATHGQVIDVATRHDETGLDGLAAMVAGCDLVVVPAGVGYDGFDAAPDEELATIIARQSFVPILRVLQRPSRISSVVFVVSGTAGCPQLARRFLHSGIWPDATVTLLPVASYRPIVQTAIDEQVALIQAHGRSVAVMDPIDLDFEPDALRRSIRRFDGAVMGCLSHQFGWFGMVRSCPFEVTAGTLPVTLLP
ncbi:cation:proton antiporter [Arenibaculum pallidiluteum]|uniref:cation:proton antiporter n=1 Tax=Arenibaculum pallidiluteum TaxID=2812559 RepID=UPI001A9762A3|nr:monovalent cation/H(+) antiporter subunit G [Arenibaculum pallidiluteum]